MACAGTLATLAVLTLASAEPVVIGTEAPFPNYTLLDASGQITGIDRDIGDALCDRLEWRCTWVNTRFDHLIPGVMTGQFDLIIGGIAVTPERQQLVSFTLPYDHSDHEVSFLGRADAPPPETARIGVQSGTIHESHLRNSGRPPVAFGTVDETIDALIAGQIDLAFVPFQFDDPRVQAAGLSAVYAEPVPDLGTAIAVCKGNAALLDPLDAALTILIADGTIDTILARWN